jgi:hypothetical protein
MKKYKLSIATINSYYQSERDGDEVFLKLSKKRIWPQKGGYIKMIGESSSRVNHSIEITELGGIIELELWEYDNFFSSSCLGTFKLRIDETGGPYATDLMLTSKEFAKYMLVWVLAPCYA